MLHPSALRRLATGSFSALLLIGASVPGCKSGDVGARKEADEPAAPAPAAPAPAAQVLVPAGTPQVNVQTGPRGLVITNQEGKETVRVDTTSGKAPENWPSEVPLYPGGKVQMSMQLGSGTTLTLETPDPIPKVIEYYQTQLARMPQSNAVTNDRNQTLMWSDPSKPLQVTLALSATEGRTRVTFIVTRERTK